VRFVAERQRLRRRWRILGAKVKGEKH
jgi:hypothetical protein